MLQQKAFRFTGNGGEYFRIWIVNLALSILTLGIYSAWAKVRRMQYFYRNTAVADASFDYHGKPIAILKGRIIAAALFGVYSMAGNLNIAAGITAFVLLMAIMPWLLVRSYRFRMHNSSYRSLRFSFRGDTGDGYVNFLLLPLVAYFTLFLLWPLAHQQITRYIRNNTAFGNRLFSFRCTASMFYRPYIAVIFAFLAVIVLMVAVTIALLQGGISQQSTGFIFGMLGVAYLGILLFVAPYLMARLQNLIWNNTKLGPVSFVSSASARDLFKIMAVNIILIILTLGLFKPFADIRLARYRIQSITLVTEGDLDEFIGEQQQEVRATGEEMAEMFDLDIAL